MCAINVNMCSFVSLHFGLRQRVGATTELYADILNKHWSKGKETITRDKESDQELVPSYGSIKTSKPITCAKDFQWIPLLLYTKEEGSREQTWPKAWKECSVCWQSVYNFKCFFLRLLLAHSQNTITIHIDFQTATGRDDTTQGILQFLFIHRHLIDPC